MTPDSRMINLFYLYSTQRLASTAGGWDWAPSRRSPGTRQGYFDGINSKPCKQLENAHAVPTGGTLRSHHHDPGVLCRGSGAPAENKDRPLSSKKQGRNGSILRSGRHISRTKQWRRRFAAVPRCPLVAGPDDPSLGGGRFGAMTPFTRSGYIT